MTEDGISLRKLRWTLGNPRLPAWACSCEHVSCLNGATVSYTGGKFVVHSADDWTSGYTAWRRSGPASRGPGSTPTAPPPSHPGVIPGPPAGPPPALPSSYPVASLLSLCLTLLLPPPLCLRPPSPLRLMGRRRWLSRQLCYRRGVAGSKCPAPHSRMGSRP